MKWNICHAIVIVRQKDHIIVLLRNENEDLNNIVGLVEFRKLTEQNKRLTTV
jgi:hypothetical protein